MPDQVKQPDGSVIDPTRTQTEETSDRAVHPVGSTLVVPWRPNTQYAAGQWVVAPGGYLASAIANFTSGAIYDPTKWTEFFPGAELAYSANETGVATVLGTAQTEVTGTTISVPQSPRPIWLEAFALVDVTTAAASGATGTAALAIVDENATIIGDNLVSFEGASGTGGYAGILTRVRIAPNTPAHQYRLQGSKGGTSFAANFLNGGNSPAFHTYIAAFSA